MISFPHPTCYNINDCIIEGLYVLSEKDINLKIIDGDFFSATLELDFILGL